MRTRVMGSVTALILTYALAACGSSSSSSAGGAAGTDSGASGSGSASSSSSSSSSGGSDPVAQAKDKVTGYESGKATFPGSTEAFSPGKHSAMVIACGFQAPVCASSAAEADTAVKAMGWTTTGPQDGKLSPQTQSGLFDKAILENDSAILMYGIDINGIKAAVDRATAKGLAIACVLCDSGANKGQVMDSGPSFQNEGTMMGWYLIAKNNGQAKVVAFQDNAFPQTIDRTKGVQDVLSQNCPSCSFEAVQESVGETAQPGPPTFTALLSKKASGTVTDAVALYDGIGSPMAKTLKSRGRTDLVVDGYDAAEDVVNGLSDGSLAYGGTIGAPITYAAWAAADLVGRKVAGKQTWDASNLPAILITKDNASKWTGGKFIEPDGDWRGAFKKLWGVA